MTSKSTHYLTQRGGLYQLRLPIPKHLQAKLHRKEIRWSLKTRDLQIAQRKVFRAVLLFDDICFNIEMIHNVSKAKSHEIVGAFYELLNQAHTPTPPMMAGYSRVDANQQAFAASQYAHSFSERLNTEQLTPYDERLMSSLLSKLGINLRHYPPARQSEILSGISNAYFEHADFVAHTAELSEEDYTPSNPRFAELDGVQLIAKTQSANTPGPIEEINPDDDKLGVLIEEYTTVGKKYGHSPSGPWGETSVAVNTKVLGWFGEVIGLETKVRDIKHQHGRAFRNMLRQLKKGTPSTASLKSSLTSNATKAVSTATAANLLGYLKAFFNWLETEDYIDQNPIRKVKISVQKKPKSEEIREFTIAEVNTFFSSPLYAGYASVHYRYKPGPKPPLKDGFFWLPLILLTTGMRIGEASEMPIRNVKLDEDVPHFLIEDAKTYAGGRKVPIHNLLFKLGFADWIKRLEKKYSPTKPLMSDFKTKMPIKQYASKRIGTFIDYVVSDDDTIVSHSFRHYFKDRARDAKVPEFIQDQIVGHEGKKYIGDHYGSGASLKVLSEELNKIDFQLAPETMNILIGTKA